jgi:hypothetical protein
VRVVGEERPLQLGLSHGMSGRPASGCRFAHARSSHRVDLLKMAAGPLCACSQPAMSAREYAT